MILRLDVFNTTTIAMCVFFLGHIMLKRSKTLREYGIPEPVIGGFTCAIIIAIIHYAADITILFDMDRRDILLVYFFAALGMRSSIAEVVANGRTLFALLLLATIFIVLQNGLGIAIARMFGYDANLGIVVGSMALTGRSGTTIAWAPLFEERFGLEHVSRLGIAANMAGLIAACCIGGPIARFLIERYRLRTPGPSANLDVGRSLDADAPSLDYYAFILALLRIHIAIIIGQAFGLGLETVGVHMPLYISCLIGGLLLGNVMPRVAPKLDWPGSDQCLTLIAYVSLGLFYSMTLMSLQLWTAGGYLVFVLVSSFVQVLLTVCYVWIVVFRAMGRDYQAAVISAGFTGITLGSTATTMAIMTAVAKQYGRAHKAFVVVPLACGVFIDIINSLVIKIFASL